MMNKKTIHLARASATVLALILAACASNGSDSPTGGSGGGIPTGGSPPITGGASASSFETAEYNSTWALDAVNAAEAYAAGATGQGVTIGVVDFNFDLTSNELRFHPDSKGKVQQFADMYNAYFDTEDETDPHGHAVAAVLAALKDNAGIHGIAFDARILALDFFSGVNLHILNGSTTQTNTSDPWSFLTDRGVRIINTSYGYDEEDIAAHGAPAAFRETAHVSDEHPLLKEAVYFTEGKEIALVNGALLVQSAGNDGDPEPALVALDLVTFMNTLNGAGAVIVAGATDRFNNIAEFSDRAGDGNAKNHYMVAPGDDLSGPWGGEMALISGTSFAAPMISGAAALVMQRWPLLTSRQVADILLASATDLGAAGIDAIYGRGLLNVGAALAPIGGTTMSVATGTGASVASSGLVLGAPFGDAGGFAANVTDVLFFDSFGRDFSASLAGVTQSARDFSVLHALHQKRSWNSTALTLGETSALSLHIQDTGLFSARSRGEWPAQQAEGGSHIAEDGTTALHFGPGGEAEPQAVFRFSGATGELAWTAGYGLSLGDALSADSVFTASSLTRPFASLLDTPAGFAAITAPLSASTEITFGASAAGHSAQAGSNPALHEETGSTSAAARLTHRVGDVSFGLEVAGLFEESTVLGSYSSGGLKLGDGAGTFSLGAGTEARLAPDWFFRAAVLGAVTEARPAAGSLFASVGSIRSSSFGFGFARENLFRGGDVLSFTFGQKLRVEDAPAVLAGGVYDPVAGSVAMEEMSLSLVPTGRERSFEAGYRSQFGVWSFDANLAYSLDARHVAGATETRALLFLSRRF
jgi:hypothetical protein